MTKVKILSKIIKTNKEPDVHGFIKAMKDMGAKVSTKEGTIVIDLRHLAIKDEGLEVPGPHEEMIE